MPTVPEHPVPRPTQLELHDVLHETNRSWTDDLPVCRQCGVGLSTNQIYREDGQPRAEHEYEDRSFHFRLEDGKLSLYGIFDGHDGSKAAEFAMVRIPAELLLGQLEGRQSDVEVQEALIQAFVAVEKGFFDSIDDLLAEKTTLQMELPDNMSTYDAYQQYPDLVNKIQALNAQVSGGTTAVLALIHNNKIYVANIGDSRALLCHMDGSGILLVTQLSVDHDMNNEDELLRLSELGLDVDKIRQGSKLANQDNTRCIGNYVLKGGYKEFDILSEARGEPVIAEPYVSEGMPLDETCRFLLLMSNGLYKSLEEATGTEQVNRDIAQMVVEQFRVQSTLTGVAQAVVDKVVRIHHDTFMSGSEHSGQCQKRDDITLLVRNFNHLLPNALNSPTTSVRFSPVVSVQLTPRLEDAPSDPSTTTEHNDVSGTIDTVDTLSTTNSSNVATSSTSSMETLSSQTTTSSTDSVDRVLFPQRRTNQLPLDEEGRIEPYVDFSDFYRAVREAQEQGGLFNMYDNK